MTPLRSGLDRLINARRSRVARRQEPVKIGLLYSHSGGLSVTESSICSGAILAVDEINASGGIGGRPVVAIVEDYGSQAALAPVKATKLIREDRVIACVGGYTSASRLAMAPVMQAERALLVYPTYFEGLEEDENIFYAGALPNQFLLDYIAWVLENLGTRIYMVGSDYIYPRVLGRMINTLVQRAGGVVTADRYVPLGTMDFSRVLEEIDIERPEVVLSNVVGSDSVPAFYQLLHHAGYTARTLPIAATVTTEIEIQAMNPIYAAGHYMTATYFGSLDNPTNRRYLDNFHRRFGRQAVTHAPQIGAYNAVWLLCLAARQAEDLSVEALKAALVGTTFDGNPEGWPITVLPNHHTNHPSYIGRTRGDGQFDVIARFEPRAPDPYPRDIVREGARRADAPPPAGLHSEP